MSQRIVRSDRQAAESAIPTVRLSTRPLVPGSDFAFRALKVGPRDPNRTEWAPGVTLV